MIFITIYVYVCIDILTCTCTSIYMAETLVLGSRSAAFPQESKYPTTRYLPGTMTAIPSIETLDTPYLCPLRTYVCFCVDLVCEPEVGTSLFQASSLPRCFDVPTLVLCAFTGTAREGRPVEQRLSSYLFETFIGVSGRAWPVQLECHDGIRSQRPCYIWF